MRECADLGIKRVWMHRGPGAGSVSPAAAEYGRQHGITVIEGGCPCMFNPTADPGHKAMRFVFTLTGNVPRRVLQPRSSTTAGTSSSPPGTTGRVPARTSEQVKVADDPVHTPGPITLTGLSACAWPWPVPGRLPGTVLPWRQPGLGREAVMDRGGEP